MATKRMGFSAGSPSFTSVALAASIALFVASGSLCADDMYQQINNLK